MSEGLLQVSQIEGLAGYLEQSLQVSAKLTVSLVFSLNPALGKVYFGASATVTNGNITPTSVILLRPKANAHHNVEETTLLNVRAVVTSQTAGSATIKAYCTKGTLGTHDFELVILN